MRDGLGRLQEVVLLGGTSDIGLAVVERLVRTRRVERIVLAGRDRDALAAVATRLAAHQARPDVRTTGLDVTDPPGEIRAAIDRALSGRADVVVDAIGMLPHDDRTGEDVELAASVFDVNTTGSGVALLRVAHHLRAHGHGTIVALSSIAAVRARADNLVYGAAKAGYDALARGLGDVLAGTGVDVLVVRPGFVRSSMTATHPEAPFASDPEDVAAAVDRALDRKGDGPRVVWVPRHLWIVAAGIRALPASVLARLAQRVQAEHLVDEDG